MNPWAAVAIGGAVLGGAGAIVIATRAPTPAVSPERVALIGDSYAVGLGPQISGMLPIFQYQGIVGSGTAAWARGLPSWLASFRPTLVLVSLGVNDGASPNSANYQSIVSTIHGMGARVVWIEPPAAVNTRARNIIASLGVPTIPATQTPLAADGLHPRSYTEWAQDIAESVRT